MELCPNLFCLSFYHLYFFLPPFKDNGLLFWVPDVLCQHSEVVLWDLLSVQMFFRWICGAESGLPVLFLCHICNIHTSIFEKEKNRIFFVNAEFGQFWIVEVYSSYPFKSQFPNIFELTTLSNMGRCPHLGFSGVSFFVYLRLEMEWGGEWRQKHILFCGLSSFGHIQKLKMVLSACNINEPLAVFLMSIT